VAHAWRLLRSFPGRESGRCTTLSLLLAMARHGLEPVLSLIGSTSSVRCGATARTCISSHVLAQTRCTKSISLSHSTRADAACCVFTYDIIDVMVLFTASSKTSQFCPTQVYP
jgi:hypothetical protein